MKKILIFSTAYFPLIGGAEVAVKEITDRLPDIKFDMITARFSRQLPVFEKIGNINVYRLGFGSKKIDKYWLAIAGVWFAKKLQKKNGYDLIWSIMASYNSFAALFFKKAYKQIPFLLTLQEGDPVDYIQKRVGIFSSWFSQIFTSADYIQAISNFLVNWGKTMGAKCPIEVVPNGVNLDLFSIKLEEAESRLIKEKIEKKPEDKLIIHTGRLTEKNALNDIISALKYLPQNIKFLSLGNGPDLKKLKELAIEIGVEKRVIFLEQVNHREMVKYLKVSDIFVRPSLSEGLGNSFLEAMAADLPIIGTRVGGIPDFLRDPSTNSGQVPTGLFCEAANPESLANKISLLLADEVLRQKLIDNAKKEVLDKYDWDKIVGRMEKIFNKISTII